MLIAKIAKTIKYKCGCMCEFIIQDGFGRSNQWHILPCNLHYKEVAQVQQRALDDYLAVLNDSVSEHDAIQLLTEKGYIVKTQEKTNGVQR